MNTPRTMLLSVAGLLLVALLGWSFADDAGTSKKSDATGADEAGEGKELLHVVALKFKEDAEQKDIDAAAEAFANLKSEIELIKWLKWGTNNSPEKLDKGFTHCFIIAFESEADRDAYLTHRAHVAFVDKWIKPVLEEPFVIDFWAQEP